MLATLIQAPNSLQRFGPQALWTAKPLRGLDRFGPTMDHAKRAKKPYSLWGYAACAVNGPKLVWTRFGPPKIQ